MKHICDIIKNIPASQIDKKSNKNNKKYDTSRVNVAKKFTNVPYPVNNHYKDYLGNYLMCSSDMSYDTEIVQQKFAIGNTVPVTLQFLLYIRYHDKIKYVEGIVPKLCYKP